MSPTVKEALAQVGASRVVHFTPAKNLDGIFRDGQIRDAVQLGEDGQPHHTATDDQRFDSRPELICCSFEYPNCYYHAKAKGRVHLLNYPEWVCLIISVDVVLTPGTMFHPCNAATGSGRHGAEGGQALLNMWADPAGPNSQGRGPRHLLTVPSDLQAEVQIPGPIDLSAVHAIVTATPEKARELFGHLRAMGLAPERVEWRSSPLFFDKFALPGAIRYGRPVPEVVWTPAPEEPT